MFVVEGSTEERFYSLTLRSPESPFRAATWNIINLGGVDQKLFKHLNLVDQATSAALGRFLLVDGAGLREGLPTLSGWAVTKWSKGGTPGDFEDQFTVAELCDAINLQAPVAKKIEPATLGTAIKRNRRKGTARALEDAYESKAGVRLDKRALGDGLARVVQRRLTEGETSWRDHPALSPLKL